jgi:hypothetical protein
LVRAGAFQPTEADKTHLVLDGIEPGRLPVRRRRQISKQQKTEEGAPILAVLGQRSHGKCCEHGTEILDGRG